MEVQWRRKRDGPKRRWMVRVRAVSKRRGCRRRKCTTVLHGGVCHRTSTPRTGYTTLCVCGVHMVLGVSGVTQYNDFIFGDIRYATIVVSLILLWSM